MMKDRQISRLIHIAVLSLWAGTGWASGVVGRVTFDGGMGGLYDDSDPAQIVWTAAVDHVSVSIPGPSTIPIPGDYALLVCDSGVEAGAFAGDYTDIGVALIGFDFKTDEIVPRNGFRVEIEGPAGVITKDVTSRITSVGSWHRVVLRLDRRNADNWQPADDELFNAVLSNVEQVRVYVGRSGHAFTRTHRLDNLFVARIHRTESVSLQSNGQIGISWTDLLDDMDYVLEYTDDLTSGDWYEEERFFAPLDRIDWVMPAGEDPENESPARIYRLTLE